MGDDDVEPQEGDHGLEDWDNVQQGLDPNLLKNGGSADSERIASLERSKNEYQKRLKAAAQYAKNGSTNDGGRPENLPAIERDSGLLLMPDLSLPEFQNIGGRESKGDVLLAVNPECKVDINQINSWVPLHPVQDSRGREFDQCVTKQSEPATFKSQAGKNNRVEWLFVKQPGQYSSNVADALRILGGGERSGCLVNEKLQGIIDDKTFKFAFVQDPWDRFVEAYLTVSLPHEGRIEAEVSNQQLLEDRLFGTIADLSKDIDGRGIDRQYLPQIFFLSDFNGRLLDFDFIGKAENFKESFKEVQRKVFQVSSNVKETNVEVALPRSLQENLYRDLLEDAVRDNKEAKRKVLQHYRADTLCFYGDIYNVEDLN
jgi:hypothetical protein